MGGARPGRRAAARLGAPVELVPDRLPHFRPARSPRRGRTETRTTTSTKRWRRAACRRSRRKGAQGRPERLLPVVDGAELPRGRRRGRADGDRAVGGITSRKMRRAPTRSRSRSGAGRRTSVRCRWRFRPTAATASAVTRSPTLVTRSPTPVVTPSPIPGAHAVPDSGGARASRGSTGRSTPKGSRGFRRERGRCRSFLVNNRAPDDADPDRRLRLPGRHRDPRPAAVRPPARSARCPRRRLGRARRGPPLRRHPRVRDGPRRTARHRGRVAAAGRARRRPHGARHRAAPRRRRRARRLPRGQPRGGSRPPATAPRALRRAPAGMARLPARLHPAERPRPRRPAATRTARPWTCSSSPPAAARPRRTSASRPSR